MTQKPAYFGPVKVKKLNNSAIMPKYAHPGDACADLFACLDEPLVIEPGFTQLVPTGLAMDPGPNWELQIRSRSGLSTQGVVVANSPGTVDPTYRGEIKVILHNDNIRTLVVKHGMKIAQMALAPIWRADFVEVESLDETTRGAFGFGSTGL